MVSAAHTKTPFKKISFIYIFEKSIEVFWGWIAASFLISSSRILKLRSLISLPYYLIKSSIIFWSPFLPSFSHIAWRTELRQSLKVWEINLTTFMRSSSLGSWMKLYVVYDIPSSSIIVTRVNPCFNHVFSSITRVIGVAGVTYLIE